MLKIARPGTTDAITFARLQSGELAQLHAWLNRPHLQKFFQKTPISLVEVEEEYGPAVRAEEPSHCHLARVQNRPFGYLQCYAIRDWPDWAQLIGSRDGIGVDLAIVEPDMPGKGHGRQCFPHI